MLIVLANTGCQPSTIDFIVEGLPGDTLKYEMNFSCLKVMPDSLEGKERILNSRLPFYYGYTAGYKSEDGDYLDCFLISPRNIMRGQKTEGYVKGVILMRDNNEEDSKLLLSGSNLISEFQIDSIVNYLLTYSTDEIVIDKITTNAVDYFALIDRYRNERLKN